MCGVDQKQQDFIPEIPPTDVGELMGEDHLGLPLPQAGRQKHQRLEKPQRQGGLRVSSPQHLRLSVLPSPQRRQKRLVPRLLPAPRAQPSPGQQIACPMPQQHPQGS